MSSSFLKNVVALILFSLSSKGQYKMSDTVFKLSTFNYYYKFDSLTNKYMEPRPVSAILYQDNKQNKLVLHDSVNNMTDVYEVENWVKRTYNYIYFVEKLRNGVKCELNYYQKGSRGFLSCYCQDKSRYFLKINLDDDQDSTSRTYTSMEKWVKSKYEPENSSGWTVNINHTDSVIYVNSNADDSYYKFEISKITSGEDQVELKAFSGNIKYTIFYSPTKFEWEDENKVRIRLIKQDE